MQEISQDFYYKNIIENRVRHLYHENRLEPRDTVEGVLKNSKIINFGSIVEISESSVTVFNSQPAAETSSKEAPRSRSIPLFRQLINYGW
jgi:hypothetical protein